MKPLQKTPTLLRVLALLLLATLLFTLAACKKDEDSDSPTDTSGDPSGTGNGGGDGDGDEKLPEGPLFTQNYNYHTVEISGIEEKELHKFNIQGSCSTCGVVFSEGLAFEKNDDNVSYYVAGRGSFTGTELAIPPTFGGFPVTRIGESAFEGDETLVSVFLGHNVKEIGKKAFAKCPKLRIAEAGEPFVLERIGVSAFEASSWDTDSRPNPVTNGAVDWYTSGFDFALPPSVVEISDRAFLSVKNARITLLAGSHLERIGSYAFASFISTTLTCAFYPSLEPSAGSASIAFPETLVEIGEGALRGVKYRRYFEKTNVQPSQIEERTLTPTFPPHIPADAGQ